MSKQACTHCGLMTPNLALHLEVAHKKQEAELAAQKQIADLASQAQRRQQATNNVIVLYEEVPESLKVYTLKVTNEELDRLQEVHNEFIDPSERDESWVFKFLQKFESAYDTNRADGAPVLACGNNTIICTGVIGDETSISKSVASGLGISVDEDEDEFEESDELDEDPDEF